MTRSLLLSTLFALAACTDSGSTGVDAGDSDEDTDAVAESHAKGDGNYDLVFNDSTVDRIDLTISAEDFQTMLDDMTELYGTFGAGGQGGGFADDDPVYVEATLDYDGETWEHIGIRYKGNSSLSGAWKSGSYKMPFRLTFDKYEDEYPEIEDQRFWGFKDLKFGSNYKDDSLVRDKVASETWRAAGVAASKGAFVRIFVDTGDGPTYWGLYTMFEDPCGELLDSWFEDDSGNCYKPDGDGAAWTSPLDTSVFEKKTNEDEADWSDIETTHASLHATNDGAAWRSTLEETFDVDGFLHYLAMNNLMQNWDVYGSMTHNYYLYGDPADDNKLTWVPWDFNEAFSTGGRGLLTLEMSEVTDDWPLIRNLMDDATYEEAYYTHLENSLATEFESATIEGLASTYHDLIAPYVTGDEGENSGYTNLTSSASFDSSVADLVSIMDARISEANALVESR